MLYSGWASISGLQVGREKDAFPHVMRPGERLRTTMIDVCLGDEGAIHGQLVTVEEEARASSVLTLTPKSGAEKKL